MHAMLVAMVESCNCLNYVLSFTEFDAIGFDLKYANDPLENSYLRIFIVMERMQLLHIICLPRDIGAPGAEMAAHPTAALPVRR